MVNSEVQEAMFVEEATVQAVGALRASVPDGLEVVPMRHRGKLTRVIIRPTIRTGAEAGTAGGDSPVPTS